MSYQICYSNGRKVGGYDTEDQARDAVLEEYPEAEIGHPGDLSEGGDRTLCWADEASSVDDDGARSVASIRVAS